MKFNFKRFVTGFLLFAGGNLALVQALTVNEFNSIWDDDPDNVYYSGSLETCDPDNPVRGCVKDAKQSAGSFLNAGDVEIRKLVRPTSTPGIFDVNVLLRGKRTPQPTDDSNVCMVIVFDKSGSMGIKSGSVYLKGEKWYSAVSGAVEFSNSLIDGNENSKIGLVLFAATASSVRSLEHLDLDESSFDAPSGDTNIHDGLVKAGNMFDGVEGCDSKYIILMSDGDANRYGPSGTSSTTLGPSKAKETASELKSQGIVIYSVGYDVKAAAKDTLKAIAQDDDHYYAATTTNIYDVFQNIRNVVELNAGVPSDIDDAVGGSMVKSGDIIIPAGTQIIDPGTIYSFQIKIKPDVTGWQASNSGLTLTYEDADKNPQTLRIAPEDTAQIYWTAPKCEGTYPTGVAVITGSDEFTQNWNGNVLDPDTKEWTYVDNSTPGECEWACSGDYKGNTGNNTCILEVTVTFNPNGGTPTPDSVTVESGTIIDTPDDPIKTGYTLTGWTIGCDTNNFFDFSSAVTGNLDLCAKWEPNKYTIVFSGNGATSGTMDNQLFTYDVTGNLNPNEFIREGATFLGWNTKENGSGTPYADGTGVKNLATTGLVTLYAQWSVNSYTVVFSGNGSTSGTMGNLSLDYNETGTLTANAFTRNGYHFSGWNMKNDGTGTGYVDQATVKNLATSGEVTLYAQWEPNDYTVVFSGNKATNGTMGNQQFTYDETKALTDNAFTRNGYHFSGWNTKIDGTGTGYVNKASVKNLATTGTVTLYAQWTPNTYTIVFSGNGATNGSMTNQTLTYDKSENLKNNGFNKLGFTFVGWNTKIDGTGTGYANQEQVKNLATTGTITLYAQWSVNTYQIEFNKNGGSGSMTNQTLSYGNTGTLKENEFTKEGYHFVKWTKNQEGTGVEYENRAEVKNLATGGVVKLYAQREPNNYTIRFDGNGATDGVMNPLVAVYDNDTKLTKNGYSKNGNKFIGWKDENGNSYTDEQVVKNLVTTGEVILYAQWEKLGSSGGGGRSSSSYACKNLPSNVEVNNTLKPSGKDVDYYYSTDVSKACTFQCKLGYAWNEQIKKCEVVDVDKTEPTPPEPTPTPTIIPDKKCSIEGSKHSAEVNEAYIWACQRGIIKSDTIQSARLGEFLNRAEMAKITTVFEMLELDSKPNRSKDCSAFADSISDYRQEMKNYMVTSCQLERMGIHTADHKPISDFMPRKFVSRAEFGTILSRILWEDKYEAETNTRYYYVDHLNKLKAAGILTNINPNLVERRSYAILMIYRAAKMMGKI